MVTYTTYFIIIIILASLYYGYDYATTSKTAIGASSSAVKSATTKTEMFSGLGMIKVVAVIILLIVVYNILFGKRKSLSSSVKSATEMKTIEATDLDNTGSGSSSTNFSYSVWIYVDDWNYKYGEEKVIFARKSGNENGGSGSITCPLVSLLPIKNQMKVEMNVFPDGVSGRTTYVSKLNNIPIQRWTNIILSVYGKTMDIYIDGKLTKTSVMSGVANIDPSASVYLTPNGGFSGWTSKFNYYATPTNPQQAWSIYQSGYGSYYSLSSLFGNYSMKMSIMDGNRESGSVTF